MNRQQWLMVGVLLVTTPFLVYPQEESELPAAYRIDSIEYEITGRTRQWVLDDLLDLEPGMTFPDELALETHLANQQQQLVNQRALQEATVTAERETASSQPIPVHVTVTTRDTWNIIVLPYAKYDSNSGLLLSLRGRDYNFFGTLSTLEANLDYELTEEEENLITFSSSFSVPFNMLEQRWRLIMDQSLELGVDDVDFNFGLGVGYAFAGLGLDWEVVYMQSYRYLTADEYDDTSYNTSELSLNTSIDTPLVLPTIGRVTYRPELYTETSYRPGGISEERQGVRIGFDHGLSAGGMDWIGNYRRGVLVNLDNDNRYNVSQDRWNSEVSAGVKGYLPLWQPTAESWPKAGVSASLSSFYLVTGADEDQDDAAADARGLLNDTMQGDLGVFANLDAVITVWTLEPLFEAQFGVFFDTALVRDLRGTFSDSSGFDSERDLRFGSGIEVIGFPLFARSLYVRGSLGFDLREIADGAHPLDSNAREIFIGLGHHY
ncbi:MAG: hypothetical protein ACOCYB_08480 [Alkalispirochaeta sp.]